MKIQYRSYFWAVLLALVPLSASAGGPLGIDHELPYGAYGIWSRSYQQDLEYSVVAVEVVGSLWLGNDDSLGHVFWQTADSSLISGLIAGALKYSTGRARPYQGDDPNAWFKGAKYQSFPSGEVTLQASFVTPLVVNYFKEDPWILALEALPIYDAIARLKSQAHWQSDVIAGGIIGTGIGYWTATWKVPLMVRILPGGVSVGISERF
jgi:PAP2 superfamily